MARGRAAACSASNDRHRDHTSTATACTTTGAPASWPGGPARPRSHQPGRDLRGQMARPGAAGLGHHRDQSGRQQLRAARFTYGDMAGSVDSWSPFLFPASCRGPGRGAGVGHRGERPALSRVRLDGRLDPYGTAPAMRQLPRHQLAAQAVQLSRSSTTGSRCTDPEAPAPTGSASDVGSGPACWSPAHRRRIFELGDKRTVARGNASRCRPTAMTRNLNSGVTLFDVAIARRARGMSPQRARQGASRCRPPPRWMPPPIARRP